MTRRIGFSFDIDGVLLRGKRALPGARAALASLDAARVPYVMCTNGGGVSEEIKATEVSAILELAVPLSPAQVVLSHTPLRAAMQRHAHEKVLVLGCRDVLAVARSYGARRAYEVMDIAADDPHRYPFMRIAPKPLPAADRDVPFGALFVLHDPTSWGVEIQIALDVILGGHPLGSGSRQSIPVYSSNPDFVFSGVYPVPRLAAGAFLRCLSSTFRDYAGEELVVQQCGKPTRMTSDFARAALAAWREEQLVLAGVAPPPSPAGRGTPLDDRFDVIYHVGDNPAADIRLAIAAGDPWRGVLVRTGVFRGAANDAEHPAHIVADNVGDAVDAILRELK